jgi:hypothetical protein
MTATFRQMVAYSLAMAGGVFISLWFIFMVLGFGGERLPAASSVTDTAAPTPPVEDTPAPAVSPAMAPAPPEPQPAKLDLSSPLAAKMQGALLKNGYSLGKDGDDRDVNDVNDVNDGTLAALEAFQDNNALPVQPTCDERCWTMLGFPDQK